MSSKLSFNKTSMKKTAIVSLVLITLMSVGQLYQNTKRYEIPTNTQVNGGQNGAEHQEIPYATQETNNNSDEIIVHIVGEVATPGVIHLPRGSRLYEAVEKSGGLTKEAEDQSINMAQVLVDGNQYIIPAKGSDLVVLNNATNGSSQGDKININTANQKDLQSLSGIGAVLAERIVEHREKIGGFKNTSQLLDVEGIGEAKFNAIKDNIFC